MAPDMVPVARYFERVGYTFKFKIYIRENACQFVKVCAKIYLLFVCVSESFFTSVQRTFIIINLKQDTRAGELITLCLS